MYESFPSNEPSLEDQKKQKLEQYISLAETLSHNLEGFLFPGVNEESYSKLKEADEYTLEDYPGYTTPIDENIERMVKEGFKVTLGDHPEQLDVYIMPLTSTDIEKDSLFPRHLKIVDGMDESLKALILANKEISGK